MNFKRFSLLLISICIAALPAGAFASSAQTQASLDCEPFVSQVPLLNAYSIFFDDLQADCFEDESASSDEVCTVSFAASAIQSPNYPPNNLAEAQALTLAPESEEACEVEDDEEAVPPVIRPYPPIHMELP